MVANPRSITDDDLFKLNVIGEFQLSPDGQRVVFAVITTDVERDRTYSNLWLVDVSGGEPRPLTTARANDTAPRWSPDGRSIAFISDREERRELWLIPSDGGEARRLTRTATGVAQAVWAPDSQRLAFVGKTDAPVVDPPTHAPKVGSDVKVYTQLNYKLDGEGFWDHRYRHIFTVDCATGALTQITDGPWDDVQPAWSPDGARIAFVSRRGADREFTIIGDVYSVAATGGEPVRLTRSVGPCRAPAWSPDGQAIAYLGHDLPTATGPNTFDGVWTVAADGSAAPRALNRDADCAAGASVGGDLNTGGAQPPLQWSPDGAGLLTVMDGPGVAYVARVDATTGAIQPLTRGPWSCAGFDVGVDQLVWLKTAPTLPNDLFVVDLTGANARRLTDLNAAALAGVALTEPERVTVALQPGLTMEGWLLHPPGFDPARRYPTILEIHGGPHGQYGYAFSHAFHRLAAEGYVVAYFNPRGSTGYGQSFCADLRGAWGSLDVHDVLAGLDHVLQRPYLDPNQVGVTGASYGGYLTNYLLGITDRFKAAVTERSTVNRIASYGTGDIHWRINDYEFLGPPWEQRDLYWERSPIANAHKIVTPLLVMQCEDDHRCPMSEGEALFTILRRLGRDVVFVRFPNESHLISRIGKPGHRRERLERLIGWFKQYL